MKFDLRIFLFFYLLYSAVISTALGQNTSNQALWYGYTFNAGLSKKWFNETELMERHLVNPLEQSQFLIRTRFHKRLNSRMNYALGGSLFLFHRDGSSNQPAFTQPELRPHGEFNYRIPCGPITFDHRLRGELRYFQNLNAKNSGLEEGYYFSATRFRYRIQVIFPLAKISTSKSLSLKLGDEIMAMTGGRIGNFSFDQNRISADISLEISYRISLDFGYVNWYQAKPSGGFLEQHIFRTVLKHQLVFKNIK